MRFDQYSCSDANMYLTDTFTLHDGIPLCIKGIYYLDEDNEDVDSIENTKTILIKALKRIDGSVITLSFTIDPTTSALNTPVPLGYYTVEDYAVFFYKKQGNFYKKLPHARTIRTFIPQSQEFDYINKTYDIVLNDVLLQTPKYYTLTEAYKKLTEDGKFSVALHKNYALVKKGKYEYPVVYYKTTPIIEYDGKKLIPLIDECHVHKFKLEVINAGRI